MRSLHRILAAGKLFRSSRAIANRQSRSIVSYTVVRPAAPRILWSYDQRRRFPFGGRRWDGEEPGGAEENPGEFASYDPISDQLESTEVADQDPIEERLRRIYARMETAAKDGSDVGGKEKEAASSSPSALSWSAAATKMKSQKAAKDGSDGGGKEKGVEREDSNSGEEDKGTTGPNAQSWYSAGKRKKGKKVSWFCESCGMNSSKWWGSCPSCQTAGSLKEFVEMESSKARGADVSEAALKTWLTRQPGELAPQRLTEVNKERDESAWRIPLSGVFGMEVARVFGGGIVPGSLVLVGGDPGVGKSTLLLQIAAIIAEGREKSPILYVSGEESIEQIGSRADRMKITASDLFLYSSTDIEDILNKVQDIQPRALIIDSIQTVYLRGVVGSAGNVSQVKECTAALLRFAKHTNIPVLLIGHVTKTGDIAGPRLLEHIVDVVLYMEGERYSTYRLLRSVKNRFGTTDELGVFAMSDIGLQAVVNPSEMFLSEQYPDSEILAGLAVSVTVDGSRPFVLEVQALCVTGYSIPTKQQFNGVRESRAQMIIAVLMKQAGLKLQDNAIFINVVSGFKLTETAGDLAIAVAICSSLLEFPLPNNIAFIGEIGLGGELRAVPRMDKRVSALAKLGYKKCVIPRASEKSLAALKLDIKILSFRTMKELIDEIFQSS